MTIRPVEELAECCACGACYSICPHNAIEIKTTNIGRKYADINDNCINCGLCGKVCPILNKVSQNRFVDKYVGDIKNYYVGKSLDKRIFENAQSGGMCTLVLKYLFDHDMIDAAVVTCMVEGATPIVSGRVITSAEQLYDSQKSCYTMVDVLSVLKDTNSFKSVAVVGLPCQMHAIDLICKVNKRYNNIKYKLGLVCDRTLCSLIQDVMLRLSNVDNEQVKIQWRNKNGSFKDQIFSYQNAPITISSKGQILATVGRENRLGLKEFFTPPSCRQCTDKLAVYADLVFGDPWGVLGIDSIKGESLVISRTDIGEKLVRDCVDDQYAELRVVSGKEVLRGQDIEQKRRRSEAESKKKIEDFLAVEQLDSEQIVLKALEELEKEKKRKKSIQYKLRNRFKRVINKIIKCYENIIARGGDQQQGR